MKGLQHQVYVFVASVAMIIVFLTACTQTIVEPSSNQSGEKTKKFIKDKNGFEIKDSGAKEAQEAEEQEGEIEEQETTTEEQTKTTEEQAEEAKDEEIEETSETVEGENAETEEAIEEVEVLENTTENMTENQTNVTHAS